MAIKHEALSKRCTRPSNIHRHAYLHWHRRKKILLREKMKRKSPQKTLEDCVHQMYFHCHCHRWHCLWLSIRVWMKVNGIFLRDEAFENWNRWKEKNGIKLATSICCTSEKPKFAKQKYADACWNCNLPSSLQSSWEVQRREWRGRDRAWVIACSCIQEWSNSCFEIYVMRMGRTGEVFSNYIFEEIQCAQRRSYLIHYAPFLLCRMAHVGWQIRLFTWQVSVTRGS